MPWIRIDENAMEHPKIGGLSDGAFRLWMQGLAHCQKFLTNGLITSIALRAFRAYSPKRRADLIASGLWDEMPDGAVTVHDYLQWNESRETVMAAREHEKERKRKWRQGRRGTDDGRDAGQTVDETRTSPVGGVGGISPVGETQREGESKGGTLTERAGAFCEWYEDTHQRLIGVGYMGTNGDYMKAQELCKRFTDMELRDAAIVWFGMNDDFATNGTRTIPKFASRASHCVQLARRVSA